jgi:hypothetical protein
VKEREQDAPDATCLFHVLEDCCKPQISSEMLRIGGVECPAVITAIPEQAGAADFATAANNDAPLFGKLGPMPPTSLTPWRLQPSQMKTAASAPESRGIILGAAWSQTVSDATRGTALHLAMRTFLTRPDLATSLPGATGLEEATLTLLAQRATALKAWLSDQGYTDLRCEIPVLGHSPDGAEIPGTIDLLAIGSSGSLLIDHKTGGSGVGFGPYWPQINSYAAVVAKLFPEQPLRGMAVFWVGHGRLELAEPQYLGEASDLAQSPLSSE